MSDVASHVKEFLLYLDETGRKPRTIEAYRGRLAELVVAIGSKPVEHVKPADLEQLLNPDEGLNKIRSVGTWAMRTQALKTFFQYLTNRGYIPTSPAKGLQRASRTKEHQEGIGDLSLIEIERWPVSLQMAITPGKDISHLVIEYIDYLSALGRSVETIKEYKKNLATFADYFLGYEIQQITHRMLDTFVSILRTKNLADATISTRIQHIKGFLKFCVSREYLRSSPAAHLKRPRYVCVRQDKIMTLTDLKILIESTRSTERYEDIRAYCLLMFLADTGVRAGELVSVNFQGLDLGDCSALVDGKTGPRTVFFTEPTAAALNKWIAIRPKTDELAVFTNRLGRMKSWNVLDYLKSAADSLGVQRSNPQSIRHLVGQSWVDRGVNLELVRIKLGHSDINTTARFYTHQDRARARSSSRKYSIVGGMA